MKERTQKRELPTVEGDSLGGMFPRVFDQEYLKIVEGDGPYLWDANGTRYIDAVSGNQNVNLGHGIDEIAQAASDQLQTLEYVGMNHANEPAMEFTRKVAEFAPDSYNHVWLVSGGSEATESALKMAVQYQQELGRERKRKVVARRRSYHGNTVGAAAMSGYPNFHSDLDLIYPDHPTAASAYPLHCHMCEGTSREACTMTCATDVERTIKSEGAENVAAYIAEPITGGPNPGAAPADGYYEEVERICEETDVLFIVDEVLTGFGRTGEKFAFQHWDVEPDIVATGKGMSAGYTPLGGLLVHDDVVDLFRELPHGFSHGHTYSFNPASCAIGSAVMDYTREHDIVSNARSVGETLGEQLRRLERFDCVQEVRGRGMHWGVELTADPDLFVPPEDPWAFIGPLNDACVDERVFVAPMGEHIEGERGGHIAVTPPLTADESVVEEAVDRIERGFETATARCDVK